MAGGIFGKLFGGGDDPADDADVPAPSSSSSPVDAPMTRDQAVEVIRDSDFAHHAPLLESILLPTVGVDPRRIALEALPIGASRFAGSPDLPPGFDWPRYEGRPQAFIAQIDLKAASRFDLSGLLPKTGHLYFFYEAEEGPWGFDPKDSRGFTVHYYDGDASKLIRTPQPGELSPTAAEFHCCSIEFRTGWTLPDPSDDRFKPLPIDRHDDDEFDQYASLLERLTGFNIDGDKNHHMLGFPQIIQGDMRIDCQLVTNGIYCGDASGYRDPRVDSLKPGVKDWRLLLQIDTDEDRPGWMWGDCGRLYFWIREDDLKRKDFSGAWMILQCC